MPRLPTLRTPVLQELARQLRFESAEAARRQLVRAEELALQLLDEAGKDGPEAYPEEWVVFRVTGLRTEAAGGGGVVMRGALMGDLPALIDRLSAAAKLTESDLPGPAKRASMDGTTGGRAASATPSKQSTPVWLSVAELCARWRVSRKTLERYRRLGLVSRRIGLGRGRERVVYAAAHVGAFERAQAARVAGAGEFSRMDARVRERLVRRAARYRARFGWTLHRCARRLAAREGRSVEAVRRVLRRHDERADRPLFDEPGPLDSEQRAWVERTARRGGSVSGAAGRVRKSRATAYRVVGERRVERLRELDLRGPVGPTFARKDAGEVLLGHAAAREGLGVPGAASVGELVRLAAAIEPEPAEFERARAGACWYLVWSAARALDGLAKHGARVRGGVGIDRIETWLLWASRIKAEMVRSQTPLLVRAIESQTGRAIGGIPGGALRELCEIGLEALIEGVERFDPFKGGRLAAPAGMGVSRAVSRWLRDEKERLGPATRAAARSDLEQQALGDWAMRVHPWQGWLDAPAGVRERVGELGEKERRVVEMRFGWGERGGPPRTMEETAVALGTTATRVSAMQRGAVARLTLGGGATPRRTKTKGRGA
jgi:transposase